MELEAADALREQLSELRLSLDSEIPLERLSPGETTSAVLHHPRRSEHYEATYLPSLTLSTFMRQLPRASNHRNLVVGERGTERGLASLRANGIDFIDTAGNAHIDMDTVLIDIRGRSRPGKRRSTPTARGMNLFSTRRAQVIFVLLQWPEMLGAPIRHIADAARVSVGLAQDTMKSLDRYGYLQPDITANSSTMLALLDHWVAAFPSGLARSQLIREFSGDVGRFDPITARNVWISGECASEHVRNPETLTIYVDELDPRFIRAQRWHTDGPGNIIVRKRFWAVGEPESLESRSEGARLAPPLLVYADLMSSSDSRQHEAAGELRRGFHDFR